MTTDEQAETSTVPTVGWQLTAERRSHSYAAYLHSLLVVLGCGLLSWAMESQLGVKNGFLVFLFGVAVVAVRYGTWPSIWASFVSVGLLAFFFMPPLFSFAVADIQHLFTLLVLVAIGVVISMLTTQALHHAGEAKRNADRFEALYHFSHDLANLAGSEQLARAAVKHIEAVFGGTAAVLLPEEAHGLTKHAGRALGGASVSGGEFGYGFRPIPAAPLAASFRAVEWSAVRAARDSRHWSGLGSYVVPSASSLFVPLLAQERHLGVLAWQPEDHQHAFSDEQKQMLTTLAGQLSGALERDRLSREVQSALDEAEMERMRSALLSSVSHDLRTPLAAIVGSAGSLLDDHVQLPPRDQRDLCQTIFDNAGRLSRIVENVLNMTRIESGMFSMVKQLHVLEEVVGSTLQRMTEPLCGRRIQTHLPDDLPLVPMDDVLFQQVLVNLLDNAQRYVPPESSIEITASAADGMLLLDVADRGPGFSAGEEQRVFEKFYRGKGHRNDQRGTGLGLTICRAIVAAHGGSMWAENRAGGGAVFRIRLPLADDPSQPDEVSADAASTKTAAGSSAKRVVTGAG